jgi:hypothetical protein
VVAVVVVVVVVVVGGGHDQRVFAHMSTTIDAQSTHQSVTMALMTA